MPLARLITRNPQDAFAVSEYLRSQGYTVETLSPGEFRITPAELELDLTRCGRSEAVDRARKLVESQRGVAQAQSEAPAVSEPPQPRKAKTPVAYDIVGRPVAFADEEEPGRGQNPNRTGRVLASLFSRVTAPVRDFQQRHAERRGLKLDAEMARRRERDLARQRARQEMERRRAEAELAERRRQEQIAADQQAEQERARAALVRAAGISATREAARQKQIEPAAAEEPAEQQRTEPASAENPVRQQLPVRRPEPAQPFVARRRPWLVVLRRAAATALGASLVALVGFVAYANRRPASPLSPGALMLSASVKQEVPFGPVTITPPATAPNPSPVAAVLTKTSPVVRPTARMTRRKPLPNASTARLKHDSETE